MGRLLYKNLENFRIPKGLVGKENKIWGSTQRLFHISRSGGVAHLARIRQSYRTGTQTLPICSDLFPPISEVGAG